MPLVAVVHPKHVMRAATIQILQEAGFAAIGAETVDDAMAVVRTARLEAAVVDDHLAGELPQLPLPWIALGQRGPRSLRRVKGACCIVDTPLAPEELVRAVRWALNVYSAAAL